MATTTLLGISKRVDYLIARFRPVVKRVIGSLTAEDPHVAALVDTSDAESMQIYRELGLDPGTGTGDVIVLDVQQAALVSLLAEHHWVPLDDLGGYVPGTVVLYVLTMGVAVARRFESSAGPQLREVRRNRDIEIHNTLNLEGLPAAEMILQRCSEALQEFWDGGTERVGLVIKASHGAKVGFMDRDIAIRRFRENAKDSDEDDRAGARRMAETLSDGARPDQVACILHGWGAEQLVWVDKASIARKPKRYFDQSDETVIKDFIAACREQKRALGLLEKSLTHLASSTAGPALSELVALVRNEWKDCGAILAKAPSVADALLPVITTEAGAKLRFILMALIQATTDRQRGGAINGRGGRA